MLSNFRSASGYLRGMSAKKEFADRLVDAMAQQGLEPKAAVIEREYNDFHPDATITVQTARAWLRGAHVPGDEHMEGLAAWLRVDVQTLRKGKSRFRVGEPGSPAMPRLGKQDAATMHAFAALPASRRKLVREVILALSETATAGKP
jgi:hypothetical protein